MTGSFVIGTELGSGGCKCVALDGSGSVVASAQQEYPTDYPYPGWAQQNPEDWYTAYCATVRSVLGQADISPTRVAGVGIAGVTHNAVLLDRKDYVLAPSIHFFDNRSVAQVRVISERWGDEVWKRTLNDISTVWTWPQLLWIRENRPNVWRAVHRVLFQKDYVRHRLAPAYVTDTIDASGTLLFDPAEARWVDSFCRDLELSSSWLPQVVGPMEIVAKVGAQGAADTGLTAGTPVIAGTTDTAAEVLGSGAVQPGMATVKLASVGRIAVVATDPLAAHHIFNYRHVFDGLWYPGTASKSAASCFRWLRDAFWPESDAGAGATYATMDRAALQAPPGCGGLVFHPHLLGEWAPHWDGQMRGSFVGLTMRHNRSHLTRAVLEGVAFALKDALIEMEGLGLPAREIRLIGQGSRSRLWSEIVGNVLNRPLKVPSQPEAAYGIALITAMALGAGGITRGALDSVIDMRWSLQPNQEESCAYTALFDIYRDVDVALRQVDSRLYSFEHRDSRVLPPP